MPVSEPPVGDTQQAFPEPWLKPSGAPGPNAVGGDQTNGSNSSSNSNQGGNGNTDNSASNPPAPNTPGPGDTVNPNSPLLPSQALNTSPLYSSPDNNGGQPGLLEAPQIYNTGAYDLSSVAANNALAQAFMQTGVVSSEQSPDQGPSPLDRIRIGPVDLKTSLNFIVTSDDNIGAQPAGPNRRSDTTYALTPAVLVNYGAHDGQKGYASVVYAPTLTRFSHYSANDSDDQNVAVNFGYPFQRLTLRATEAYTQTTGVNLDARERATQSTNIATLGADYEVDDRITLQNTLQYLDTSYSNAGGGGGGSGGLLGDTAEALHTVVSYRLSDKLSFGPGVNIGIESPENGVQQTFQQVLLDASYQPTDKISLYGQGGVEFRQYLHGAHDTNPVFSAGVNYRPTQNATLNFSGNQSVQPASTNTSQTTLNTGVAFSASEKLFQRYILGFSFFYAHSEYNGTGTGSSVTPETGNGVTSFTINPNGSNQDNLVYRPSLSFAFSQWSSIGLYYQHQDNESSVQGNSYHDNQAGVSVSAQF